MTHTFRLKIEKEKSRLSLLDDDKEVESREWEEGRDMGRRLFEGIAELLKENNLEAYQISDMVIESLIPENYTSMRIAETVKKVYTFSVNQK
jgi:hypothetical protein